MITKIGQMITKRTNQVKINFRATDDVTIVRSLDFGKTL